MAGRSQEPCEPGSGAMVGKNLLFSVYKRKNSNWATVKYRAAFVNSILGSSLKRDSVRKDVGTEKLQRAISFEKSLPCYTGELQFDSRE